jgi:hypothetical protein
MRKIQPMGSRRRRRRKQKSGDEKNHIIALINNEMDSAQLMNK